MAAPMTGSHGKSNSVDVATHQLKNKLSLNAGEGSTHDTGEAVRVDKKPAFDGVFKAKPTLDFRITNIKTGKEEQYDPSKHFFHREKHHPSNAAKARKELQRRKKDTPDLQYSFDRLSHHATFKAAGYLMKPGGAVVKDDRIYSHRHIGPEKAKAMHDEGTVQRLNNGSMGSVYFRKSRVEEKQARDRRMRMEALQLARLQESGIELNARHRRILMLYGKHAQREVLSHQDQVEQNRRMGAGLDTPAPHQHPSSAPLSHDAMDIESLKSKNQ